MTPESRLIAKIAKESAGRICRRVVLDLQRLKDLTSADDSGLKSVWDEICVQVQSEESAYWDAYDRTVRDLVAAHLDKVPKTELEAVWLQTTEGKEWLSDVDRRTREIPWYAGDVEEHIVQKVYDLAGSWSNRRIRAFLDLDWRDDG